MKRRRKGKQDRFVPTVVLGAAPAADAAAPTPLRQKSLPFASDPPTMNASQPDSDSIDAGTPPPAVQGVAHFDPCVEADRGRDLLVMPPSAGSDRRVDLPGRRLRVAREACGMDLEQAAARLRLPQRLLQAIEADDHSRIEHGVYLRGYLKNYARLLGLPEQDFIACDAAPQVEPPPLVATGTVSHSRYLYQRYSVPAVYVLLTGLILGPSVWLATHGGLERNLTHVASLDVTPAATTAAAGAPTGSAASAAAQTDAVDPAAAKAAAGAPEESAPAAAHPADQPLMASLAPFPPMPSASTAPAALPAGPGHRLQLKLSESSWVEVIGEDGRRLEYSILAAGSEREYASTGALTVRLGNASGAEVRLDGRSVDLAPYRRANVALFRAFGAKGAIASAEN